MNTHPKVHNSCAPSERLATIENIELQQELHQLKLARVACARYAARIRSQEEGEQPCNEK